ncbi:tyrosine-type recombinase/integrase [Kitasatospora sp. NPDC004615]|uniref:tyrosine-type recombinase/integrase n=1 Tax=Kitasatospora sp. NPDC004615 TaxID=3364017 RepID=UPI0036AB3983
MVGAEVLADVAPDLFAAGRHLAVHGFVPVLRDEGFLVTDPADRLLMHLCEDRPGMPWPGHWTPIRGWREADESAPESAAREVREEAGIDITGLRRLPDPHHGLGLPLTRVLHASWDGNESDLRLGDEVLAVRMIPPRRGAHPPGPALPAALPTDAHRPVRPVNTRPPATHWSSPCCRCVKPLHGLPDNFTMIRGDLPSKPERNESGQDLPTEVMGRLCTELDRIEERSGPESRVGIELLIDTGRRPDEICELSFDCLKLDGDGKPVLIYDNRKEDRPRRELPLHESTAAVIRAQQKTVRTRFPDTPARDLKLLPSPIRNPRGEKAISESTLSTNTRIWVDALPEITLDNGTVFDKAKIFPYAFRHTYAQRHADAGVPVDVLSKLLDHDTLEATRGYYRVKEKRLRQAVDQVTRLQFDRHGSRIWQQAKTVLEAQRNRRSIGEVAVAFGRCSEPTNVTAGGGQCPLRFRCLGCDHFSTDVSYLPELRNYLDDLLRTRERLSAMSSADDWAKREAMPSDEEISRVRRLIRRVTEDLDALTEQERTEIKEAVATVRKTRQGFLGMPRIRQPLPDVRPERP